MSAVTFHVNDSLVTAEADDSDMPLVEFLQERMNLTGTKFSCGIGVCRACTVAVRNQQGAPLEKMLSCSTPLSLVQGLYIYTVEGLASSQALAPLQQAFLEHFSFQCGYCTPGFLMAATVMMDRLQRSPVSDDELESMIMTWVGSNVCRCTGYVRYVSAIKQVAMEYTVQKTGGVRG